MKTKTLAQVDGFIGIIAGAILAFLPIFMLILITISRDEDVVGFILGLTFVVFSLVKIATLILGVLSLVYYKDDERISLAPSILFIVGSVVALIPFLGWIGGVILVIGGALYLASLKQFRIEE